MAIKYIVVPSPFAEGKFFARTLPGLPYTLDEAITAAIQETALTESEVQGVVTTLVRLRDEALAAGRKVDFGALGRYSLRVRASLDSPNDPLPPDYELVLAADVPRQTVTDLKSRVSVEREEVSAYQPVIHSFYDAASKQEGTVYTAGAPARISGAFLAFDGEDDEQGVFFVAADDTAVRATVYLTTGNKEVECSIPAGLTGPQSVEVRTRRRAVGALLMSDPFGPLEPA